LLEGVELVLREILAAVARHGVAPVEALGRPFDPALHEAMAQIEDASVPGNTVVQVFQPGYQLRGRLLRPARVVVSKPPETKPDDS
jgi:molecular chaperone GrpE